MRPGGHFGELVAFLEKLILNLPREAEAFDLLTQLVRFFQRIIAVSELRRDGTHLLPQIILPLIAVDGFVYLLLDILLQFQDIGLPREHRQQEPHPFFNRDSAEDPLLFFCRHRGIGRNEIREISRLGGRSHR